MAIQAARETGNQSLLRAVWFSCRGLPGPMMPSALMSNYCLGTGETHEKAPQLGHLASLRPTGRWGIRAAATGERLKT